jgi:hypothetical protein
MIGNRRARLCPGPCLKDKPDDFFAKARER